VIGAGCNEQGGGEAPSLNTLLATLGERPCDLDVFELAGFVEGADAYFAGAEAEVDGVQGGGWVSKGKQSLRSRAHATSAHGADQQG